VIEPGGCPDYWPGGARREGGVILVCGSCTEREKASVDTAALGWWPWVARGSLPTAETGGTEYQSRRSLADRPVLAVKLLLIWGGGGAKGLAHQECRFVQPGP
jgi:hypothetical protein